MTSSPEEFYASLDNREQENLTRISKQELFRKCINKSFCARCSHAVQAIIEMFKCRDTECSCRQWEECGSELLALVPLRVSRPDILELNREVFQCPMTALREIEALIAENPTLPGLCPLPARTKSLVSCPFQSARVDSSDLSTYLALLEEDQRDVLRCMYEEDYMAQLGATLPSLGITSKQSIQSVLKLAKELRSRPLTSAPLLHSTTGLTVDLAFLTDPADPRYLRVVVRVEGDTDAFTHTLARADSLLASPRPGRLTSAQDTLDALLDATLVVFRGQMEAAYRDHHAGHAAFLHLGQLALRLMVQQVERAMLDRRAVEAQERLLADLALEERRGGGRAASGSGKGASSKKGKGKKGKAPAVAAPRAEEEEEREEEGVRAAAPSVAARGAVEPEDRSSPPPTKAAVDEQPEDEAPWEEVVVGKTHKAERPKPPAHTPPAKKEGQPVIVVLKASPKLNASDEFPPLPRDTPATPLRQPPSSSLPPRPPVPSNNHAATPAPAPRTLPTSRASSSPVPAPLTVPIDPAPLQPSSFYSSPRLWESPSPAAHLGVSPSLPYNPFITPLLLPTHDAAEPPTGIPFATPSPLAAAFEELHSAPGSLFRPHDRMDLGDLGLGGLQASSSGATHLHLHGPSNSHEGLPFDEPPLLRLRPWQTDMIPAAGAAASWSSGASARCLLDQEFSLAALLQEAAGDDARGSAGAPPVVRSLLRELLQDE